MSRFTRDDLDRIEAKVDGLALLDHLGLLDYARVSEKDVRRCCPIHKGDNPSAFAFDLAKKRWRCFTRCDSGGDIFSLAQKVRGLNFTQAVRYLAKLAGVKLSTEDMTEAELQALVNQERRDALRRKRERLLESCRITFLHAPAILPVQALSGVLTDVPDHLGITAETWREFGGQICVEDFDKGELRSGRHQYPRGFMTNRVVLPVKDPEGRTVGFAGRRMREYQEPKWLYSRGFAKSSALFGVDKVRPGLIETGIAVLVEGPKDVLGLWQRGVRNAVAVLGCEVSQDQVAMVNRYTGEYWIAFDGDEAGDEGAFKAAAFLKRFGIPHVYRIPLPPGMDPDELTPEEWQTCVSRRYRI